MTEDLRVEPLARALHPGEWWDSPGASCDVDKTRYLNEARQLLGVTDSADSLRALLGNEEWMIDLAASVRYEAHRALYYYLPSWDALEEHIQEGWRNLVRREVGPVLAALRKEASA